MDKYLLIAVAIENATFVFMFGSIFYSLRMLLSRVEFFRGMLSCFMCTSFWVSVFMVSLYYFCPYQEQILLLLALHGVARYIQMVYHWLETGSSSTLPLTKTKTYYED